MIKVLIAEDSPVMQQMLEYVISSDSDFMVVGIASDGDEAVKAVNDLNPDVITMDWNMPNLNGKEATRIIMETNPKPIVIVTGSEAINDLKITFNMIEAGALAFVKKPTHINDPDFKKNANKLKEVLKLMSEVKLVRRIPNYHKKQVMSKSNLEKQINRESEIQVIVIGASTGGPLVIQKILSGLPSSFTVPILIVQHITQGFTQGLVDWLASTVSLPIHIAEDNEYPLPGHVYIAPDNFHMGINYGPRIELNKNALEYNLRPSVSYLFQKAADNFGAKAVGILLTGMGHDGAAELKLMKDKGSVTFVQDKESSIVYGMPGEAIKVGAATYIFSPEEIIVAVTTLIKKMNG